MVMFDYQKLWLIAGGDSTLIIRYFLLLAHKEPGWEHLVGVNFIVNESIITDNPLNKKAIVLAEYLGLCSLRAYATYKLYGTTNLSMEMVPSYIPKSIVDSSPWVELRGEELLFTSE